MVTLCDSPVCVEGTLWGLGTWSLNHGVPGHIPSP